MNIFDKYYLEYDKWYDTHSDVFATEVAALKEFDLSGKGVEIGVGTGRFAETLKIKYGVDPSANMLSLAAGRGIRTINCRGETTPFKSASLDFTVMIGTLCFAENPELLLEESRRILKKGGIIVAAILRKDSSWVRHYREKNSRFYKNAKFFSSEEVIGMYEKTGLTFTKAYQSLFKSPTEFSGQEKPEPGYDKGSFVALSAVK